MRLIRWPLQALAITAITVVLLELVLQLAAWWLQPASRAADSARDSSVMKVLTLGDSNTFGIFVAPEQPWPAQLEQQLKQSGQAVQVINLGWPGTSSTTLNWQFTDALKQVKPDLVLVMIGVNDSWTRPIYRENVSWLQKIKLYSRSYRFLLLSLQQGSFWLKKPEITHETLVSADVSPAEFAKIAEENNPHSNHVSQLAPVATGAGSLMLGINTVPNSQPMNLKAKGFSSPVHYSTAGMLEQAQAFGVPLVLVNYGADIHQYQDINNKLHKSVNATGLPLIDVRLHLQLKNDCLGYQSGEHCKVWFYPDNHPTAEGYRIIAAKVAEFINNNALFNTADAPAHQRAATEH